MWTPNWMAATLTVAGVLATPAPAADIDGYLREHREQHRIPGLAYAVVTPDRIVQQGAWGVDGAGAAVTAYTPFLIGSVSKPFTATAVMRLAEAGRLGLDDPVRRHLPWFRLADASAAERITVRHLLNHTSGLPRWASRTDRFDNSPDGLARSVRDLATVRPESTPGAVHQYSDANYMVLGALVETVTGQAFGTALHQQVLDPLDMTRCAATADEAQRIGLSAGHRYWFGRPRRFDAGYDTSGVPYGYLAASLDDLTRFVSANLDGGRRLLSTASIAAMHTGRTDAGSAGRYGLGWRESRLDGVGARIVWHAGATPGYFAHVVVAPESGLGVVVLANSYSYAMDGTLADMAFTVARMAHGAGPGAPAAADPVLTASSYGLVALAAILLIAVAWSARRLVRPSGRTLPRRRRIVAAAWVAGCATLAGGVLAVPAAMGGDLGLALLWAPDIGWTIVAVLVLTGILMLLRVGTALRTARRNGD
jgi:CubicO group peptidase (beta-lactamase class C family)